jgi:pyruvate, orthophosphate dikinase
MSAKLNGAWRTGAGVALMLQHSGDGMTKWVYVFGDGQADGQAGMKNLLGGKGGNLAEMCAIGLPVPPGFTITTEVCTSFYDNGRQLPATLAAQVDAAMAQIGQRAGARFGDKTQPLLVSVRSGARASMPGMMDTILNLGLNDETVEGLTLATGNKRFAFDSYRRFISMYADVVLGVDHGVFEDILDNFKNMNGHILDTDLAAEDWVEIVETYKDAVQDETGKAFPQDTRAQLWGAIEAVFGSWQNDRAISYRRMYDIPDAWGTAVNVQSMVFGNRGETSATGDVVAGIRTPQPLTEKAKAEAGDKAPSLEALMPKTFDEFAKICTRLEAHYRDMQDIEFTVQEGKLWMLQTRSGKRTTTAALKIAVDLAAEGVISKEDAVLRIEPASLDQLLHPTIDAKAHKVLVTQGLPASPGAASGEIVFDSMEAKARKAQGKAVILVRVETSPEDIEGMAAAVGILTARGGMTSHAAVVARGMGRPCVCGAGALRIDAKAGTLTVMGKKYSRGDVLTIDGATGEVLDGFVKMREPELSGDFGTVMGWADQLRKLGVRANADTPRDAKVARDFGAEGIGLCRTEHMFFDKERILAVREMICADDEAGRRRALAKILPMQRSDFEQLFEIMAGLPVTIRLLDPPLHEFLPHETGEQEAVAAALKVPLQKLKARVDELHEFNPMLGFRGCRLAMRYPEITEMQARAIFEAASHVQLKTGRPVMPEVMIPLVAYRKEFDVLAEVIRAAAQAVATEMGVEVEFTIGTMVELPRAALKADEIARGVDGAEFFSFGTNDLTQTCLGLSRDDAAPILENYSNKGVFDVDPFVSIDQEGVGELVRIGTERGRREKPDLKIGICGEHGGDPASVEFFHRIGLSYVSCSPFRVPVARLAAAQAAIRGKAPPSEA